MSGVALRQAGIDDAAEIHELLLRVAGEIPILVDTLEREEALYALCRNCARSGESWVACDDSGHIVGVALVQPLERGRHYAEGEILDLRYAAVAPECRGQGVFAAVMAKVLARLLPVVTRVGAQNRADFARRLEQLGFRRTDSAGGEQHYRWDPGTAD